MSGSKRTRTPSSRLLSDRNGLKRRLRLSGLYVDPNGGNFVFPSQVSPKYKLAIGAFFACESDKFDPSEDNGKWRNHIAIDQGGMFVGFPGLEWWWTEPVIINPINP
jgi:hypothetical protein